MPRWDTFVNANRSARMLTPLPCCWFERPVVRPTATDVHMRKGCAARHVRAKRGTLCSSVSLLGSVPAPFTLVPRTSRRRAQDRHSNLETGTGVGAQAPGDDDTWAPAATGAVGQALVFAGCWRRVKDLLLQSPETYSG